ncbi:hypothetical protein APR51_36200 [Variovorax paradoxus]|nr:hypothetical protein APR52_17095 [Variovorax paradoxus]KPV15071.1 hypothetical protein APR51_36200 [Variovorax paradoxus]
MCGNHAENGIATICIAFYELNTAASQRWVDDRDESTLCSFVGADIRRGETFEETGEAPG